MASDELHVVTGAFGYSGRYIAQLLLEQGKRVRTLTGHPERANPLGDRVEVKRMDFDDPDALAQAMEGAAAFYNTYWIRFERGELTFDRAVENSRILISAAVKAGVRRFIHVSITNPSEDSPFPYFRGKARVEAALKASGLSYAMLRPTVLFGKEDILINNIAWLLRRLPAFGIFGDGCYQIQPIFVGDLARLAVAQASVDVDRVLDAVGPETFEFEELVRLIRARIGSRARLVHVPPTLGLAAGRVLGWLEGDVTITRDEIGGLMANLLVSERPPTGETRFSEWLKQNADDLGRKYASELARHY